MERHARRRRARARLLTTTTHGRNDAMAKYYGDIAKAAKGTFAMKTRMDVTRRGVNDLIRLIERCCSIHAAQCL